MRRPEVKHISTEAWVDFARSLPPPQKADQMKHHLEGCKKCRKAYDMWRAVAGAVSRERKYRPSETAVQRAKEMFALREVWGLVGRKAGSRLIFDSFLQPLPKGGPEIRWMRRGSSSIGVDRYSSISISGSSRKLWKARSC